MDSTICRIENDQDFQHQLVEYILQQLDSLEPDLILRSEDGETVSTNKRFLGFFSPMMTIVSNDLKDHDVVTVLLPYDIGNVNDVIRYLKTGKISSSREDLEKVCELMICLGIPVDDAEIIERTKKSQIIKRKQYKPRQNRTIQIKDDPTLEEKSYQKEDVRVEVTDEYVFVDPNSRKLKKMHTCDICDKTFSRSYQLKQHKVVHSEVRKFKCSECYKTFKTKAVLYNHKGVHNPIHCSFKDCDAKFSQMAPFIKHKAVVHLTS